MLKKCPRGLKKCPRSLKNAEKVSWKPQMEYEVELKNKDIYIDELKHVKKLVGADSKNLENEDFDF